MKFVFPICKADGSEFKTQSEIESILKKEDIGQYGYNPSHFSWHAGVHFTAKNVPWAKDKYPVRAIADGKVVACRISKHYQESTYKDLTLSFSNDFCLVEHEFLSKDDSGHDKKFVFYSLYMHLAPIPENQPIAQTPRKLHKLKKRRNARELPGLNGPKSYLKTGSQLELIESEPEIEIDAYTFRRYTMVDNAGNNDDLAKVGATLWIADDNGLFDVVDEVIPNYPTPQWLYKKYKGKITSNGLSVRSDPTGNQAGSTIGKVAKDSEFEFVVNSGYKSYDADGHQHIMALCTFKSGATRSDNVTPIRQGWIAVDQGLVDITAHEPLPLDTLNSLGSNSSIRVKAGDPIGYLGQFDVLAPDSEAGFDTRYQVHFEVFAKDKPTDEFVKAIFAKDDLAKVSYISDLDSNGFCDPDNPREFFVKLANNTQEAGDSETQEMTPEQIVNGLSAWDANKFTIVQHESEWYDKAESKSIFETLLAMFKERDIDLPAKLEHEKERVNTLIWMQDESKIGFGKHVWSWWPVSKVKLCIPLKQAKEIALKVSGGYEGQNPSYSSLAGNFDGAGMSWGIIQFNFGQDTLGPLLLKMRKANKEKFDSCFSENSDLNSLESALDDTIAKQINWAVDMQTLHNSRWKQIFNNLASVDEFQKIQLESVEKYDNSAISIINWMRNQRPHLMEYIELSTFVALHDLSVQQGSIDKAKEIILEQLSNNEPKDQREFVELVVKERGATASSRWRADCISRRLGILNRKKTKVSHSGQTSERENTNFPLIIEGHICDL